MKFTWLFLACLLFSCNAAKLYKDKEATIIFSFERAAVDEGEYYYFFKSSHLIINGKELDSGNCITQPKEITEEAEILAQKRFGKSWKPKIQNITSAAYFSKNDAKYFGDPMHYSDNIYEKNDENGKLYIVYRANCDVIKFNKLSQVDSISCNRRYSCPIEEDLLNVPFYYVVNIDSFYPIDNEFLSNENFIKFPVDTFRVNYCD